MRSHLERNGPLTRREILNALAEEPGLTKSQLCRLLDLSWGTISHHVRILEASGSIERRLLRHRRRYFARGTPFGLIEASPLTHDALAAPLLRSLVENPGIRIRDLAVSMSVDRRTIRRHLDVLIDSGLVAQTRAYRPQFFVVEQARAREIVQLADRKVGRQVPQRDTPGPAGRP